EIFVRKPSGVRFPIKDVIPGNRISLIKKKIYKEHGIPIEEQRLSFNDVPLKDEKTVVGSGIRNGNTIDLGEMIIYVRNLKGEKYTFKVDPDELVENVKKMIEIREGTPVSEQQLYFNETKLDDDGKPILHFNIKHKIDLDNIKPVRGAIFDVAPQIEVSLPHTTKKIKLSVLPKMTVEDLKDVVEEKTGTPKAKQRIFFLDSEGNELDDSTPMKKTGIGQGSVLEVQNEIDQPMSICVNVPSRKKPVRFAVDPSDTIRKIKRRALKKIKKNKGESARDYCLVIGGRELDDGETLERCKIQHDALLSLEEFKLRIMHWSGKIIDLDGVTRHNTVASLKKQICRTEGIPLNEQRLSLYGRRLEDKETMEEVKHKTILMLPTRIVHNINITVKHWNGDTFTLHPAPNDYIDDVKDAICKITNIPNEQLRLLFQGRLTCDDMNNLMEQNIVEGSVLELEPMRILLELPTKTKLVSINVELDQTLYDVKKVIVKMTKIALDSLCIMFGGVELDYTKTLSDYGIEHEDTLRIETFEIKILQWSGEMFTLNSVGPNDTTYELKNKIADSKSFPPRQQIISLKGQILNDVLRLKDQGIKHRSVLML
ncbi:hypothetical protein FRACYDRAFT_165713, partial [Fragilariopsis cylindrus CCMP1102]